MSSGSAVLDQPCSVPDWVVVRPFEGESIVLNMRSGRFHGLNETAVEMLEQLRTVERPRDALGALTVMYDADERVIAGDLSELVILLRERGILE